MATILLIDDEPELRATMREILEEAGYAVLEASEGQMGVQQCQESPVDLVVTDLLMPGYDGFQTIRALRRLRPSPKIIVCTGAGSSDRRELLAFAQEVGADRTLPKPLQARDFLVAVRELLGETAGQGGDRAGA
jgi:DNA-binding response OmpR family regulator